MTDNDKRGFESLMRTFFKYYKITDKASRYPHRYHNDRFNKWFVLLKAFNLIEIGKGMESFKRTHAVCNCPPGAIALVDHLLEIREHNVYEE